MTVTLVYATKPKPHPLTFVLDPSDAVILVQQKIATYENRYKGALEAAAATGGAVSSTTLLRWRSAKWIELEIPLDNDEKCAMYGVVP